MITIFKTVKDTYTPFCVEIDYVFEQIKNGKVKDLVAKIKLEKDKHKRNELKILLPAICFSGKFKNRAKSGLIKHSGYICLDFDSFKDKETLNNCLDLLKSNEYVMSCFISPSGDGIKVIVKIPKCNAEDHEKYFLSLAEFFNIENFDTVTKDVSRVCYASYDKNIYINKDSLLWDKMIEIELKEYSVEQPILRLTNDDKVINYLVIWFNKKYGLIEGKRNNNLFIFCSSLNEFGISESSCQVYCHQFATKDFSIKEIDGIIKSAYSKKEQHNTKFFNDNSTIDFIKRLSNLGNSKKDIIKKLNDKKIDIEQLDSAIDKIGENFLIETFWKKSKSGTVTIINNKFKHWLKENGFSKYYPENSDNYVYVYRENNLVDNTNESKIKDYVLGYLTSLEDISIFEVMAKNTSFFTDRYLNIIENIKIEFKEDTNESAYIYFKNCSVEVTPNSVNLIDYIDLNGFVWKKHIINKEFKKVKFTGCDFEKFIFNISAKDKDKELAIKSTIGYLLHSYKNSASNFAVILNDETISENPNGGTGKGIIINAISKMKRCSIIDGKTFSFDKSFPYQTVSADTHIIAFDDVRKNFNFENLFSIVTEGITLEKKNKDAIKIPIEKSPKVLISTNYAVGGEGNSFERRKWDIELAQHYTIKNTPLKEFGKLLFDQWDDKEWLMFYNYMIDCLQLYLKNGLIKAEFTNSKLRSFIASTCNEFNDWVEEGHIQVGYTYLKKEYWDKFIKDFPDKKMIHNKTFNKWVKAYATYKDLYYSDGNGGSGRWFMLKENENAEVKELITEEAPF